MLGEHPCLPMYLVLTIEQLLTGPEWVTISLMLNLQSVVGFS